MTDEGLIEDEDGAPFPVCHNCPDQIEFFPGYRLWLHVFDTEHGRSYRNVCQYPTHGVPGQARATRGSDDV